MSDLIFAFIRQVELEKNAGGLAKFATNGNHVEETLVCVGGVPFGPDFRDAGVHAHEVEVAVIEVLDHLGCGASLLLTLLPMVSVFFTIGAVSVVIVFVTLGDDANTPRPIFFFVFILIVLILM